MTGVDYDELVRLAVAGKTALNEENLKAVGLAQEDIDAFAMWDANDTLANTIPIMAGIPRDVVDHVAVFAFPRDDFVGLLATHTATGILLGLWLAKSRRG